MQVFRANFRLSPKRDGRIRGCPLGTLQNSKARFQRSPCCRPNASVQPFTQATEPPRYREAALPHAAVSRRQALSVLAAGVLVSALDASVPGPALAALKDYNLFPDAPVEEVSVQLGTEDGEFIFTPSTLEFTAGRIYKLKLSNPSSVTHYFTPYEFAHKAFSIMVLVGDPAVEVKGAISEVALKAGASATWIFMPMKPGKYPLRCTVKGHEAMQGTIIVKRAAPA